MLLTGPPPTCSIPPPRSIRVYQIRAAVFSIKNELWFHQAEPGSNSKPDRIQSRKTRFQEMQRKEKSSKPGLNRGCCTADTNKIKGGQNKNLNLKVGQNSTVEHSRLEGDLLHLLPHFLVPAHEHAAIARQADPVLLDRLLHEARAPGPRRAWKEGARRWRNSRVRVSSQ